MLFCSPFLVGKTHKKAQKGAKVHKNAPLCTDACNTPFITVPLACTQLDSRAPKPGHVKAGRSDVNVGGIWPRFQWWSLGASSDAHSALQNKGCRLPARIEPRSPSDRNMAQDGTRGWLGLLGLGLGAARRYLESRDPNHGSLASGSSAERSCLRKKPKKSIPRRVWRMRKKDPKNDPKRGYWSVQSPIVSYRESCAGFSWKYLKASLRKVLWRFS